MTKQEAKVVVVEEEELEELPVDEVEMGDGLFKNDNKDQGETTHGRRVVCTMRATVMNSIRNNPRRKTTCIGVVLLVLLVVVIISAAIALDLLVTASTVQEFQVTSVSLDVSQPLPMAHVELVFKHGSRLSRVEPQGMTCTVTTTLDDNDDKTTTTTAGGGTTTGGAAITVSATQQKDDLYLLQATCPEQDVEAHAALLWDVLTKTTKDTTTTTTKRPSRRLGDIHCTANIKAYLGHFLPVTHTASFDFSGDDLVQAVQELKEQEEAAATVVVAAQNSEEDTEDIPTVAQQPSIVIRQAHLNQMEIGVRLGNDDLPDFVYTMTPTLIVKLPPMNIVVQQAMSDDSAAAGVELYMEGLEATFVKNQEHDQDQELVFGIVSNTESKSTPWFGPIIGLYSGSSTQGTTVQVTVDAGDASFLETVIGHDHRFNVHFRQEDQQDGSSASSLLESSRLRRHRNVQENTTAADNNSDSDSDNAVVTELEQEMQKRQQKVAADCMSVDNDSNDFEFSMCWLFQLSKGFAFVGNMTLYDYFVSAVTETTWEASTTDPLQDIPSSGGNSSSSSSWVKISTSALVEVGNDRDVMNITGGMTMDLADDVQFKMTMVNDGEIWPFEALLSCHAALDENNIFTMNMSQASYKLKDELLADATGSLKVDVTQLTTEMLINDPNMQFSHQSAIVGNTTSKSITTYTLFDKTIYNFVGESRFENEAFYLSSNETVSDTYFTSLYSIVDGGLIARTAYRAYGESVWDTVMEWRTATEEDRRTFVASVIDPSMEFIVQGALLNNGVVLGNSTMGWLNDRIWDSNMEAKWKIDDMDLSTSFEMELVDDVLAYRLASAFTGGLSMEVMGFDYTLNYLTFDLEEEPFVNWTGRLLVDLDNAPLLPGNLTAWNITLDLDDRVFDYQLELGTLVRLKEGQAKIVLKYLTFVLQEMQHADMTGEFKLQFVNSTASLKLQDTAELDFVADFITSWFSNSSGVGGQFDKANLTVGRELYMDIATGQVIFQGPTGFVLIASNPLAKLQLGTGVNYASFAMVEWNDMLVGWDGERFFDIHGHFMLDPVRSIQFFIEDSTTSLDFTHNITSWWESQVATNQVADNTPGISSSQSTLWVEPRLRVGSKTYFDMAGSFQLKDEIESGQGGDGMFGAINTIKESLVKVTSAPAAELQMGMVFSYDLSTTNYLFNELKVEWDDVHVGWQDNTFFDIHGHYTLDPSSEELFVEDSKVLDFSHNITSRWFAENTTSGGVLWGGFLDKALLRVGPVLYLDSAGSFAWENVELDAVGLLNFTSTPTAALQLGTEMRVNYFAAADQFRVLLDSVRLGWKDDMYFESPGTFKKALPSSLERKEIQFNDVSMVLVGVGELAQSDLASFEKASADWVEGYFAQREGTARRFLQDATPSGGKIYDVETTITVTGQDVGERTVNGETMSVNTLSYNQTLIYMATDDADEAREYAILPFSNDEARSQYESTLIQDIGTFSNLQVPMETPVIKDTETEVPRAAATDGGGAATDGGGGLSPGAIAGIVGAGVIVVIVLGLCAFLFLKHNKASSSGKQHNEAEDEDLEDSEKPEMALTGQEQEEHSGRGWAK